VFPSDFQDFRVILGPVRYRFTREMSLARTAEAQRQESRTGVLGSAETSRPRFRRRECARRLLSTIPFARTGSGERQGKDEPSQEDSD
jgi:hypothetical protein